MERFFRRDNVIKSTDSDYQAENYLDTGYVEVTDEFKTDAVKKSKTKTKGEKAGE